MYWMLTHSDVTVHTQQWHHIQKKCTHDYQDPSINVTQE